MAPPRDIPGFYYDAEKKKYFKIQPNHAVPAGSQYTSDGVKRRKQLNEAAQEEAWQRKEQKRRVLRNPLLNGNTLVGGTLAREYGKTNVTTSGRAAAQALVSGWSATEIMSSKGDLEHRSDPPELTQSTSCMSVFAYDTATHALYHDASSNWHDSSRLIGKREVKRPNNALNPLNLRYLEEINVSLNNGGNVTALELEPNSRTLLSTWSSSAWGHPPEAFISPLLDPQNIDDHDYDFVGTASRFRFLNRRRPNSVEMGFFAACPAPPMSTYLFAMCSTRGLHAIDKEVNHSVLCVFNESDALAIDFFQGQCLMSGERNGRIQIYDPRNGVLNPIIFHPSAVRHIKQINPYTVVVAGLHSTLCNYDTRYCKPEPQAKSWPMLPTSQANRQIIQEYTMPVMKYPSYKNDAYLDLGFDVNLDDGLVAAVCDKEQFGPGGVSLSSDVVNIFSAHTGDLLQTLDPENEGSTRDTSRTKALRFVPYRGEGMPKSLWVAKGLKMISYDW